MAEDDKSKPAFSVESTLGFWECDRMPFGLSNAPATFQRLMEEALLDLPNCFAYRDDVIIYSSGTVEEHLAKVEKVFERLQEWGLKLKPKKCHLLMKRIKYLGHIVSEDGVEADPEKIEAVRSWPVPSTVQQLWQALGFFCYYRRFVKDFSKLSQPLHDLVKGLGNMSRLNKKTPVKMDETALAALENLRDKLTTPPILAFADYSKPFELHMDASGQGLGAVLYQEQDGKLRVIAYASRGLKPSETNYPAHKLEFLALKWVSFMTTCTATVLRFTQTATPCPTFSPVPSGMLLDIAGWLRWPDSVTGCWPTSHGSRSPTGALVARGRPISGSSRHHHSCWGSSRIWSRSRPRL